MFSASTDSALQRVRETDKIVINAGFSLDFIPSIWLFEKLFDSFWKNYYGHRCHLSALVLRQRFGSGCKEAKQEEN